MPPPEKLLTKLTKKMTSAGLAPMRYGSMRAIPPPISTPSAIA